MVVGVQQAWSTTASSNGSADTNINFAEGQSPPSLNNSARAEMAAIKGFANQLTGAKTTGGSANAQTYTSDSVAAITTLTAGRAVMFVAGYTNSGATTLNVDGTGATAVRKGGAASALAANDIVAEGVYFAAYNGTYWILLNPETGQTAAGNQPLDATLTAFAALSWSSGNPLVQFTAADTISLTLAPSVTTLTAASTTNTTAAVTAKNTADSSAVVAVIHEGSRATQAVNDSVYDSWKLKNSTGSQIEFARETVIGTGITAGAEAAQWRLSVMSAGSLTAQLFCQPNLFSPVLNDSVALGTGSLGFADLFLASGGVINWDNGNATLTHSTGLLTSNVPIQAGMALSTETGGTLTSASANKYLDLASGPTLPNAVFTAGQWQYLIAGSSSRTITRGASVAMYVNGTDSATCTLAARGTAFVFWDGASTCYVSGDVS